MADPGGYGRWAVPIRTEFSAARITVEPLAPDTLAQIVWVLHRSQIQLADSIPAGMRAAVARHVIAEHVHECITRACPQARAWAREFAAPVEVMATRPA